MLALGPCAPSGNRALALLFLHVPPWEKGPLSWERRLKGEALFSPLRPTPGSSLLNPHGLQAPKLLSQASYLALDGLVELRPYKYWAAA